MVNGLVIFIALSIAKFDEGGIYVTLGLVVLSIIVSILKWITIKFYIKDSELIYKSGIINSKKLEIPFDKINTIDINKNIIDRIFNVCTLKIDTGALKEVGQEIRIKVKKEDAYEIRNFINKSNDEEIYENLEGISNRKEQEFLKTISFKEIFLYSISKSKIFWAFGGIFLIGDFLQKLEEKFNLSIASDI
ncbi:hypothetical protein A500_19159, partial [Clostridium sartagoforme AAU1]